MNQYDRELEALDKALANGDISQREYNESLRELENDYRADAREAAEEAYRRELDNW